jgi:hypothetical protein
MEEAQKVFGPYQPLGISKRAHLENLDFLHVCIAWVPKQGSLYLAPESKSDNHINLSSCAPKFLSVKPLYLDPQGHETSSSVPRTIVLPFHIVLLYSDYLHPTLGSTLHCQYPLC